uniref:Armadillo repeat-containing protein 6 n=1 Tax=Mesocestoides corti TaxID=53468 RepID=A0A5K3FNV4_MESCO
MQPSRSSKQSHIYQSAHTSQNSLFLSEETRKLSLSSHSPEELEHEKTAVQCLIPYIEGLAKAIEMVVNFRDDALAAIANVPKLTRLLNPDISSMEHQYDACVILHKLADREASRNSLASYSELTQSLVRLLQTTQDINTQTEASLALRKLCYARPAASAVRASLSVANLVQLLNHPTETILLTALSILHKQMLFFPEEVRPEVRQCGGPIQLASLLTPDKISDPSWLAICTDAIRMTAYEDVETKLILLDCDICEKIVYLLQIFNDKYKLQHALARLVKVLSVSSECKRGFVEAGAVQVLTQHLTSTHNSLVLETLWGLRNMSDHAFHLTDTKELLNLLVPLVSSPVENIAICTVGCLCNLTCQNAVNKATLIELDGVPALCGCLVSFLSRDEVTEPVCSALRNLTHQNDHAALAVQQIHECGVLEQIVSLLHLQSFPSQLPLVKAVAGLVRNIALSRKCRRDLHQLGATGQLLSLFQRATEVYEEATRQRSSILSDASELSYIEGVRVEDLLEILLAALHSMAKHSLARVQIVQASGGTFGCIVHYLYSSSEFLQRAALGLLNEVSVSSEGSRAIEKEGAIPRITDLVHSENPKTATYSASILHRVAVMLKPPEYQRRLSKELRQSLLDSGVLREEAEAEEENEEAVQIPPTPPRLPDVPREPLPHPASRSTLLEIDNSVFERDDA